MDALLDAYRSGGGVGWNQLGTDAREAQAAANRPLFLGALPRDYLPSVPEINQVLARGGRVADVGCGFGWSAIGLALAHPHITVDGYDLDAPSIEAARRNAVEAGVADRVRFHLADAAARTGRYDLVIACECIHDLPDPVSVLAAMRTLAGPDGVVVVMDERVAETFTAPGDEIEQLMYGYSLVCCLPDGMAHPDSVGTGTVLRPDTLRRYAAAAGFGPIRRARRSPTTSSRSYRPTRGWCHPPRCAAEKPSQRHRRGTQPARMAGHSASTTRSGQSAGSSPYARWWAYRLPISMPVTASTSRPGRSDPSRTPRSTVAASRRRRGSTRRSRNRAIKPGVRCSSASTVPTNENPLGRVIALRKCRSSATRSARTSSVTGNGSSTLSPATARVARSCLPEKRR